tara:strand:+ start:333 stop:662 length:330 start_codon:yes stop_codon:yes gene_type:complete
MKNKTNIIFGILLIVIFALVTYIIFSEPTIIGEAFDESSLREEIRLEDSTSGYWQKESIAWHNIANVLGNKSDSLANLKPSIKYYYNEKYTFNTNATTNQLDSVIRSIW